MKSLTELKASLEKASLQINSLLEKDDLSSEDSVMLERLEDESKALEAEIASAEKLEELKAKNDARLKTLNSPSRPVEAPVKSRVESVRANVLDDLKGGFKNYGDFALTVRRACADGARADSRLLELNSAYGNNTEDGADGGFLVPPEFSNMMLERAVEDLPVLEQCDKLSLRGNSVVINGMSDADANAAATRHGGVVVYWVGEGDQVTRSSMKFRQITLRLNKCSALSFVTDEELESVVNFDRRLLSKQAMAIRDEVIEKVMFGTGVGTPLGAFTGTSPCVEVSKETGQTADTINSTNLIKMNSVIWSKSRGKGQWYYNGECLPQLHTMTLNVGTGGSPAYWPPNGLAGAAYSTIFGRPAYETDHCEALGDAGDIVYADWSQYLLAMRGTVNTAMSIHLRFDYHETAFRSTFRIDGRPAWDTNLKPRKGAAARRVSPFVKLAERA